MLNQNRLVFASKFSQAWGVGKLKFFFFQNVRLITFCKMAKFVVLVSVKKCYVHRITCTIFLRTVHDKHKLSRKIALHVECYFASNTRCLNANKTILSAISYWFTRTAIALTHFGKGQTRKNICCLLMLAIMHARLRQPSNKYN